MLDKVEVVTVQGLMEYMYKGECMVKDREGLKDMSELVKMLGIDIKLEQKPIRSPDATWWGRKVVTEGKEPNLEETVQNGGKNKTSCKVSKYDWKYGRMSRKI